MSLRAVSNIETITGKFDPQPLAFIIFLIFPACFESYRSFSTEAGFKISNNTTRRKTRKPISFNGVEIRAPLTMYFTNEKVWYKKNKESNPERAEFIMQKSHNTAIIDIEKRGKVHYPI